MKPKDIATVSICILIIFGSIFYLLNMSKPKVSKTDTKTEAQKINESFNGDLTKYQDTREKIEKLVDYGAPALENIGRPNPFAPAE